MLMWVPNSDSRNEALAKCTKHTLLLKYQLSLTFCTWRCGGSLVGHQTNGAEVPDSNPASPHNDPDVLQDHCVTLCRHFWVEGETFP